MDVSLGIRVLERIQDDGDGLDWLDKSDMDYKSEADVESEESIK